MWIMKKRHGVKNEILANYEKKNFHQIQKVNNHSASKMPVDTLSSGRAVLPIRGTESQELGRVQRAPREGTKSPKGPPPLYEKKVV